MKSPCVILLTAYAAATFCGCAAPPGNTNAANANANSTAVTNTTANATPAPPTVEALKALESKAFDAFSKKDTSFFKGFLTSGFVESWRGERVDRASAIKAIGGHKCEIKGFSMSDEKLTKIGTDTAIITMMVTRDGTCGGEKMEPFISGTLFARTGNDWKAAWHGEVPVVDPEAPAKAKTQYTDAESKQTLKIPAEGATLELAAIERSVWEGWMNRDGKKLDGLTARDLAFVNIFGGYYKNREDTLKNWTENPCEITSVGVEDPTSVSVTSDTSILMHRGIANGTCFGQKVDPILGTSVYVKEGSTWKLAFTMNMPGS